MFKTAYGEKVKSQTVNEEPSLTQQQFKEDVNIHNVMARYIRTGHLDFASKYQARYMDVPAIDFQEAQIQIALAQEMFNELPAKTRAKFFNDPGKFLEFAQNSANGEEMVQMGLATKAPQKPTTPPPAETAVTPTA